MFELVSAPKNDRSFTSPFYFMILTQVSHKWRFVNNTHVMRISRWPYLRLWKNNVHVKKREWNVFHIVPWCPHRLSLPNWNRASYSERLHQPVVVTRETKRIPPGWSCRNNHHPSPPVAVQVVLVNVLFAKDSYHGINSKCMRLPVWESSHQRESRRGQWILPKTAQRRRMEQGPANVLAASCW